MMLCSRCKKRPAVVFITAMQGEKKKNDGLCLVCAKELHVPQIDEYMKQMGITDEELEQISNQMMDMMDGESFEMGGSGVMPQFLQSFMKDPGKIFGNLKDDGEESNELQTADGDEEIPSADYTEIPSGSRRERRSKRKKELRFLGNYCTNLTRRAAEGKLDAIIGRDKEIARVIQILSRRTKNNPCLIGEPGVGKTAIAEGIALRIHSGNVPMHLKDKQVYLLDLTSLVAGTQFRGQFESRVKGLLAEVKQEGNIILFIDEVHNLVGAGNSEGAMNAANILKPALSRGEVQVIGATTFEEYRKYIEKDSALERRFQPVTVNEPTVDETIEVLNGIAKYYESYHRVHISPEMIRLCAVLSERYITDRFLPDKAIDLLDESCACTNLRSPEIEAYDKLAKKKEELEAKEKSIEDETEINFEELAQVKGELIRLNTSLEEAQKKLDEVQVTADDLSKVIELWTGIPAHKIAETEFTKLAHLEDRLKAHIIGQDEAVESLAKAIKRTRVQLSPRRRPASFIFVGPTGVGKTELVKVLSQELFDSNDPLIRLDMTEFMEKHSVARMIGSPPGYVGYDEAGQLTEKVRRRPYSVILFDEIEKAHPDVFNTLLQLLDDGRLTDSQGRTVDFRNTIVLITSNLGARFLAGQSAPLGFAAGSEAVFEKQAAQAVEEAKKWFRPELVGRLDELIVFRPLSDESMSAIAEKMLCRLEVRAARSGYQLRHTPQVGAVLAALLKQAVGAGLTARGLDENGEPRRNLPGGPQEN